MRNHERGFTLIELMITVAIIAVLALIAVPAYFSQSRKSKASAETAAMFAELSTKEEQFKIDSPTAQYLAVPVCAGFPSAQLKSLTPCIPGAWTALHLNPPESTAYCSYAVTVGPQSTTPSAPVPFHMASDGTDPTPVTAWYFILATCDMDNSAVKNSTYFMSSMDTRIQSNNPGF